MFCIFCEISKKKISNSFSPYNTKDYKKINDARFNPILVLRFMLDFMFKSITVFVKVKNVCT